ncbi:hypothetical protein [Methylobacterium sp. J-090]|uniref:hypothetical protein n=1 Tax=Methylobacterium sp. J-090 TaxID=2836666 RepID=UPI001FB8F37C|nr:hypothetical protein [Methylobacterium sp. J-090]MCJ2082694.1 hypothetical protein [Methylobacterium sp. J-090]
MVLDSGGILMPALHGPFKAYGEGATEALKNAHQKAQSLAPGTKGKVSTRVQASGTTEDANGYVMAWVEFQVQVDD